MIARWDINYWKSGSGFSHVESVAETHENSISTADELKKSVLEWWYEDGWGIDKHDGHQWDVVYYPDSYPYCDGDGETVSFWVYPEDVKGK